MRKIDLEILGIESFNYIGLHTVQKVAYDDACDEMQLYATTNSSPWTIGYTVAVLTLAYWTFKLKREWQVIT
jgi:hypothetical protein